MKTKVLLVGAALAVTAVTASAETIYSSNVVGYVNLDLVAGWNMVANPLDAGVNTLNTLMQGVPDGSQAAKFQNGAWTEVSAYDELFGEWEIDYTINPGEGFFINLPEAYTVTFVGEVKAGEHSVALPAGWSMVGSPTPVAGTLADIGLVSPAVSDGDQMFAWSSAAQRYLEGNMFDELFGDWSDPEAQIQVGQAFLLNKNDSTTWTRNFEIK